MTKDEIREQLKEQVKEKAYSFFDIIFAGVILSLFIAIILFGVKAFTKLLQKLFPSSQ